METKLDFLSRNEVEQIESDLTESIAQGNRYFTVKGNENMHRILVVIREWLSDTP